MRKVREELCGILFGVWIGAWFWACGASAELESGLIRAHSTPLNLPLSPQLYDYHTVNVFPQIAFDRPVRITAPVGERDRLFVVEQGGRVWMISHFAHPQASIFLDLTDRVVSGGEAGLLNVVFHPQFERNGFFFVFYTLNDVSSQGTGLHDRLSRFRVLEGDSDRADVASEIVLLNQFDRHVWHNGGGMAFGPDGYLYLTVGDEGSGADALDNSQRIDRNFFSGMLRIDVDMRAGNLPPNPHPAVVGNYLVPADNPFVDAVSFNGVPVGPEAVRTEFYAVGLRNAWRFSFDSKTGSLYCNDTGETTREEVNRIVKGGNYGWAHWEGSMIGPKWRPGMSKNDYKSPLIEYGRELGNGIAGGLLYRGEALPSLDGSYVFSDFWNGFLGRFYPDGNTAGKIEWLLYDSGISDIGIHPATGEILLADWFEGIVKRLVAKPDPALQPLPQRLSETGVFRNLEELLPSAGVVPYEINVPFWSDFAVKQRWFSLPNSNQNFSLQSPNKMHYPAGAVWIKQFNLKQNLDDPASIRRLETRILVQTPFGLSYGVTYRWNDSQTDATLVPASGLDENIPVQTPQGTRVQVWRYPSRRECFSCHNSRSSGVLGFTPAQLNKAIDYGCGPVDQLQALSDAGFFQPPLENAHLLPALARLDDASQSLEYRVRSYLEANCANCHQPGGVASVPWDARITSPLRNTHLLYGKPSNHLGNPDGLVIAPGSLDHSILFRRISQSEVGRMPPLASNELDPQAIRLLRGWIVDELSQRPSFADWQTTHFGSKTNPHSLPNANPDGDEAVNFLEFIEQTHPLLPSHEQRIRVRTSEENVEIQFRQLPNRLYEVQWTDALTSPTLWQTLKVPENRPFVSASPFWKTVADPQPHSVARFYRVIVIGGF